ncbi:MULTISPECIES: aspartyl-phosphate phosphatase Spo0E family protein [Niallia]|uniref:aspartyl-phosphate phosphatase Spo0E family protein n=1 Tax=Niallia TaxID=2837506 RepID=UPI00203E7287|nr:MULTISPECIES: aspartyl-phosphate phosphatase Spo0E family protein [Niallia]MCM3032878.1 aspartyl-phosphate phosphatase Spo0E family protein [Niallia sp. MER 6]MDK8643847.1 aspartyl-phosphate phosphatase Spo0E family protein [Niallia taxi]
MLSLLIENKRKEMIETGLSKGFNDNETLRLSRELDSLINKKMLEQIEKKHKGVEETKTG